MKHLISATELAHLGKCERQLYFDHYYGIDNSFTQAAIERGNRQHQQFIANLTRKKSHWLIRLFRYFWRLFRG